MNLYQINPSKNYLKALSRFIFKKCSNDFAILSQAIVILPTKRASLTLKKYFCEISEGGAAIMPQIMAIGEGDEERVNISKIINNLELGEQKKIISKDKRVLVTSEFIANSKELKVEGLEINFEQSLKLAKSLLELLDNFNRYEIDYSEIQNIFPEELASHKQNSISFIEQFFEFYEAFLSNENATDIITSRNQNIKEFTVNLQNISGNIFICGSTGTIPSTRKLIREVLKQQKGYFVLPYIDAKLNQQDFVSLLKNQDFANHQYHIAELLDYLKAKLSDIDEVDEEGFEDLSSDYISDVMQPATKIHNWSKNNIQTNALPNIIKAKNQLEEAKILSLIIREKLEENKNIAVVTNSKVIANDLNILLQKYGISADYSFGNSLNDSLEAKFILSISNLINNNFSCSNLLDILKNKHSKFSAEPEQVSTLENEFIRKHNIKNVSKLSSFIEKYEGDKLQQSSIEILLNFSKLEQELDNLHKLSIKQVIKFLGQALALVFNNENENDNFTKVAEILANLAQEINSDIKLEKPLITKFLNEVLSQEVVRANYFIDNKITILSSIEARLMHFDCVILAGLNQDIWPQNRQNIWLNDNMLKTINLPNSQHFISSAAHDFAALLHHDEVYLSYSQNIDGDEATKSQFLNRIEIYFDSKNMLPALQEASERYSGILGFLEQKNQENIETKKMEGKIFNGNLKPYKISATGVERALKNPYEYYAKEILRLYKNNPLEKEPEAMDYGNFIHKVIEDFTNLHCFKIEKITLTNFTDIVAQTYKIFEERGVSNISWLAQANSFASWFCEQEIIKAPNIKAFYSEISGSLNVSINGNKFTLKAKLDRVEEYKNGALKIIDFKTGKVPSAGEVKNLKKPQLPLEGLIAKFGAFEDSEGNLVNLQSNAIQGFEYYCLKNSASGFDIIEIANKDDLLENCKTEIERLIVQLQNSETTYLAYPEAKETEPKYSDYLHLMRMEG